MWPTCRRRAASRATRSSRSATSESARSGRAIGWLAGLWAGALLGIGLIAAPAAFASGVPEVARAVVGRMFAQEAYLSLALGVVLLLLVRSKARVDAAAGAGSLFSTDLMLVLGTLFCTVAGYFAVQPMLEAARAGQGSLSFGALHAVSAGFYALKTMLIAVLAWRGAAR